MQRKLLILVITKLAGVGPMEFLIGQKSEVGIGLVLVLTSEERGGSMPTILTIATERLIRIMYTTAKPRKAIKAKTCRDPKQTVKKSFYFLL